VKNKSNAKSNKKTLKCASHSLNVWLSKVAHLVKPPLGVPSLEIHRALRIKDLSRAVAEDVDHKKAVKQDWLDELYDLVQEHNHWIESIPRKVGNPNYTGL